MLHPFFTLLCFLMLLRPISCGINKYYWEKSYKLDWTRMSDFVVVEGDMGCLYLVCSPPEGNYLIIAKLDASGRILWGKHLSDFFVMGDQILLKSIAFSDQNEKYISVLIDKLGAEGCFLFQMFDNSTIRNQPTLIKKVGGASLKCEKMLYAGRNQFLILGLADDRKISLMRVNLDTSVYIGYSYFVSGEESYSDIPVSMKWSIDVSLLIVSRYQDPYGTIGVLNVNSITLLPDWRITFGRVLDSGKRFEGVNVCSRDAGEGDGYDVVLGTFPGPNRKLDSLFFGLVVNGNLKWIKSIEVASGVSIHGTDCIFSENEIWVYGYLSRMGTDTNSIIISSDFDGNIDPNFEMFSSISQSQSLFQLSSRKDKMITGKYTNFGVDYVSLSVVNRNRFACMDEFVSDIFSLGDVNLEFNSTKVEIESINFMEASFLISKIQDIFVGVNSSFVNEQCCSSERYDVGSVCMNCDEKWYKWGDSKVCNITECNGTLSNDSSVCSSRGECFEPESCKCESKRVNPETFCEECQDHYYGENCDISSCDGILSNKNPCSGHGVCVDFNECECELDGNGKEKYYGENCEFSVCNGVTENEIFVCGGNGACVGYNNCSCLEDYKGYFCDELFKNPKFQDVEQSEIQMDFFVIGEIFTKSEKQRLLQGKFNCCDVVRNCEELDLDYCVFDVKDVEELLIFVQKLWIFVSVEPPRKSDPKNFVLEVKSIATPEMIYPMKVEIFVPDTPSTGGQRDEVGNEELWEYIVWPIFGVLVVFFFLCCWCCICCTIGCGFCFFWVLSCSCITCSCGGSFFSCLCCVCLNQRKRIFRYKKLDDFDILLKEQLLHENETKDIGMMAKLSMNEELYKIDFNELKVLKILGEGGSDSVVFKSIWQNRTVAFKCFKTRLVCSTEEEFKDFEKEVSILSSISHPSIVRFFGCSLKPPRVGIVMEFCENGELLNFFQLFRISHDEEKYEKREKLRMCHEIASALIYLHSRSIIHRDLKCENVLVDQKERCKVMDFGLSRLVREKKEEAKLTKKIGTSYYIAPEVINDGSYDERCDVFSFGVLVWIVFTENERPYGENAFNIEYRVANDSNLRPSLEELKEELSEEEEGILELVSKCWEGDYHNRIYFDEVGKMLEEIMKIEE